MFEPRRARCRPIGLRPESCWNDDKEEIDRTVVGSVTWTTSPDAKAGRRPFMVRARGADRERTFFPTTHIQYNTTLSLASLPILRWHSRSSAQPRQQSSATLAARC